VPQNNLPAIGQALRGQARVYLDTVNATQADALLQEALRLSEGQEDRESRARLLDLLAENMLNLGRLEQAQAYQAQAPNCVRKGQTWRKSRCACCCAPADWTRRGGC
jgi:thioredoxin-like negative regulator of GroEL